MYIKRKYGFWMIFSWSKKPFIMGFIYAFAITTVFAVSEVFWSIELALPWQPNSVLDIAVALSSVSRTTAVTTKPERLEKFGAQS